MLNYLQPAHIIITLSSIDIRFLALTFLSTLSLCLSVSLSLGFFFPCKFPSFSFFSVFPPPLPPSLLFIFVFLCVSLQKKATQKKRKTKKSFLFFFLSFSVSSSFFSLSHLSFLPFFLNAHLLSHSLTRPYLKLQPASQPASIRRAKIAKAE